MKKVLKVFKNVAAVIRVHVDGRTIRTTPAHRFFTQQRGWQPAKELQPGDLLRNRQGPWIAVEKVEDRGEVTDVYNLRIADFRTYFIGCLEWDFSVWSHNTYDQWVAELSPEVEAALQKNTVLGNAFRDVFARIETAQAKGQDIDRHGIFNEVKKLLGAAGPVSQGRELRPTSSDRALWDERQARQDEAIFARSHDPNVAVDPSEIPYQATPTGQKPWRSEDTGENAEALRKALGLSRGSGYTPHHIVESTGQVAENSREMLEDHEISVNDKYNGVPLLTGSATSRAKRRSKVDRRGSVPSRERTAHQ